MTTRRILGVVVTWIGFESLIDTRWSGVYFEAPWVAPTTIFLAQEHIEELAPARAILWSTVGDVLFVVPLYPQLLLLLSDGIPESSNVIKDLISDNL